MVLFVRLVRLASPLLMVLASGLPFSVVFVLVLFFVLAFLLLLIIVALSSTAMQRVMRIIDTFQSPCHCNCRFCRVYRSRGYAGRRGAKTW